jgi:pimeloyl-ACP methyl ester carboxylesterase
MSEFTWQMAKPFSMEAAGLRFGGVALGKGAPVVLLHGFPEHHGSWMHTLAPLAAAGFRAIALDLKGYRLSDAPRPGTTLGDYRVSTIAREMGEVLRAISPDQPIDVVGHDWGGVILSAMLSVCPQRVRRAVWVNGPGRFMVPWRLHHVAKFNLPGWAERRFWRRPVHFITNIIDTWSHKPDTFTTDQIRDYTRQFQQGPAFKCAMAYYRSLKLDVTFLGPAMLRGTSWSGPALVVWGQRDPIFPPLVGRALAKDLNATLVEIEDAGHFPQTESPERVNQALVQFLAG